MSEAFGYSLIDEPWIPCERLDGTPVSLGIGKLLVSAHELRAVAAPSAPTTASLQRLLLAVLHRVFGPKDRVAWLALYRAGRFDGDAVGAYLEKWRERFDLFDPVHPFYQAPGMGYATREAARLEIERSEYGAPVHLFENAPSDASTSLTPARAACALVTMQAFHLGGLMSRAKGEKPSAAGAPLAAAAMALVLGETLFETLVLNLLVYDGTTYPIQGGNDRPAWEAEPIGLGARPALGWLDRLTWQSRRILLLPNRVAGQTEIDRVIVAGGMDLVADSPDPMTPWRTHEKRGVLPVRFRTDRAVWRDSTALFRLGAEGIGAPKACEQLARFSLHEPELAAKQYRITLYGQDNQQAVVLMQRSETLPLPLALLNDDDLVDSLSVALQEEAEKTSTALYISLCRLAEAALSPGYDRRSESGRKPQAADVNQLIESTGAQRQFWAAIRPAFDELLLDLASDRALARARWREALRTAAQTVYARAASGAGESARAFKGAALGERELLRQLARIMPKEAGGAQA